MSAADLMPGIKPGDALKAFETIHAEIERVRPLNYRSPLFTRWKQIVGGALTRFFGPDHPHTIAFQDLRFHGPMPKSPMDPPVSQKDIQGYAESMDATAAMLVSIIHGLLPPSPAAEVPPIPLTRPMAPLGTGMPASPLAAPPISPLAPPPLSPLAPPPVSPPAFPPGAAPAAATADAGFRLVRGHGDDVGRQPGAAAAAPAAPDPLRSTHDLSRHAGSIPAGGLRIVSRSGVGGNMATIEAFIEQSSDPQEKELLAAISASVDDPAVSWETMKHLLAELWWLRRETVQKILPIILRR